MAASSGDDELPLDVFQEPSDYYQPDKPHTFVQYTLQSGCTLSLRLLGHSPLWGHLLWNAAQVVTSYLEANSEQLVKGKSILELGAGAGLPSLAAMTLGAQSVVVTDYPDVDLIENLQYNIDHCEQARKSAKISACGYLWGNEIKSLTASLQPQNAGFDVLIMADILFNHSEHSKLIKTMQNTLSRSSDAVALVFFTPYRPWLLQKDLHFFDLAREHGFVVNKVVEHTMDKVMFEADPGDELLRRTVFGYEVRWPTTT